MCVNLPLSFDRGWWECGNEAAERGKNRWVAGMGGVKGLSETTGDSCEIETERDRKKERKRKLQH